MTQAVREQIRAVDRDLPVFGETTMAQVAAESVSRRKFTMQLVGLFGILALLLAGVGIYGVIAYSVTQRTREIGIRVALGASRSAILRWVLKQGMILTVAGIAVGLLGAFAPDEIAAEFIIRYCTHRYCDVWRVGNIADRGCFNRLLCSRTKSYESRSADSSPIRIESIDAHDARGMLMLRAISAESLLLFKYVSIMGNGES